MGEGSNGLQGEGSKGLQGSNSSPPTSNRVNGHWQIYWVSRYANICTALKAADWSLKMIFINGNRMILFQRESFFTN